MATGWQRVEQHQVWIYLVAIAGGLLLGAGWPRAAGLAEPLLWPALGFLLYATFTQVPLERLGAALRDRRFLTAVLAGNFLLLPLLVWGLAALVPLPPAVLLGVLLVLLVPCTDWYLAFTHLAGGDAARAIAVTPLNLLLQLVLLPGYLWLMLRETFTDAVVTAPVVAALAGLIGVPLLAAYLTERLASRRRGMLPQLRARTARLPVPLLALVVFLVAASQLAQLPDVVPLLPVLTAIFGGFLLLALLVGTLLARGLRLRAGAGRAAVFSLASRNSFLVLPLALALAEPWRVAAVVVVYQSLVELLGLVLLVALVPRLLPARPAPG